MDDTVDMLEDLPANLVTRILKNFNSTKRSTINKLLKYPGRQCRFHHDNLLDVPLFKKDNKQHQRSHEPY